MADYPVTLSGARKSPLTDVERINGFSTKYTIPYSDVAVATATGNADTVTVTLGALPARWAVNKALVNITTAFAGTTALTIIVGTTSTTNAFISSTSVLTAATIGSGLSDALTNATATATKNLVAIFTNATGGSPSALTAGSLDIYLNVLDMGTSGNFQ
tara:strand:- start:5896 stop:6372 length:477 start_codon:yes stop_codon:yes gene_type:complete